MLVPLRASLTSRLAHRYFGYYPEGTPEDTQPARCYRDLYLLQTWCTWYSHVALYPVDPISDPIIAPFHPLARPDRLRSCARSTVTLSHLSRKQFQYVVMWPVCFQASLSLLACEIVIRCFELMPSLRYIRFLVSGAVIKVFAINAVGFEALHLSRKMDNLHGSVHVDEISSRRCIVHRAFNVFILIDCLQV